MKKFKLLSLGGLTIAGIHFFNKYISEKALVQNNSFTDFEYKWSYGVIRYSKQGNGTPVLLIHDLDCWKQFLRMEIHRFISREKIILYIHLIYLDVEILISRFLPIQTFYLFNY